MLHNSRIPLNLTEHDAVDALIAKNSSEQVSITRRDPGDSGPLLVHIGDDTYEVTESGKVSI